MKGISVIIAAYNREAFLEEAIRSVLAQNYDGPLEIIVSDDGSTDRSVEIAESFDALVRVVRKSEGCSSQGVSGTRNRGLAAATQPYVAFLDSDDFYLPDHLNRAAAVLEQRRELGFVFARMLRMREEDGRRFFSPWTRPRVTKRDVRHPVVSGAYVVSTNILVFRSEVFKTVGVFNEAFSNGEDGDLWIRISESYQGAFVDHYGAIYRMAHGSGQLSGRKDRERILECAQRIFGNALERCLARERIDRYRLFRLRLTLAPFGRPCWLSLLWVAIRHPVFAVATAFSPRRLLDRIRRKRPRETTDLQEFAAEKR